MTELRGASRVAVRLNIYPTSPEALAGMTSVSWADLVSSVCYPPFFFPLLKFHSLSQFYVLVLRVRCFQVALPSSQYITLVAPFVQVESKLQNNGTVAKRCERFKSFVKRTGWSSQRAWGGRKKNKNLFRSV